MNLEGSSSASSSDGELNDGDECDEEEDEDDDEVCGICQLEFESSCPACKVPGDDCPLSTSTSPSHHHLSSKPGTLMSFP